YGAAEVRAAEERRAEAQRARIDELSRIFLSGPVLALPRTAGFNLVLTTTGATPLPDAGIVYTNVRVTADWGALEAAQALVSIDRQTVTVPAPSAITTGVVAGEGWRLTLAEGWRVVAGPRAGDYAVAPRTQ
ncbi:MAG TPA: hypothetical protein VFO19_16600, partial [Vicinamibacterales bacterium]|nr:hypothetical protein [Vicinamibacterales bacterium]